MDMQLTLIRADILNNIISNLTLTYKSMQTIIVVQGNNNDFKQNFQRRYKSGN